MRYKLSHLLLAALSCAAAASAAAAPFRLALIELSLPRDEALVKETVEKALSGLFPDGLEIQSWKYESLDRIMREGRADAILGTAGHLARLTGAPLRPLATIVHSADEDPNRNEGAAIVVRRDRSDLKTLADLKGKRAAANSPLGFAGYLLALGEIGKITPDPQRFFSSVDFMRTARATEDIAYSVLSGKTDAGLLRLCALEDFEGAHPEMKGELRVLNRRHDALACAHSTDLYPGFTLAVTPSVKPETARRITIALLSMPPTAEGSRWSLPTDLSGIDELYRSLKTGPYAYLSVWSLEGFLRRYCFWILALGVLLAGLALHGWRSRALMARREKRVRLELLELGELAMKEAAASAAGAAGPSLLSALSAALALQGRARASGDGADLVKLSQAVLDKVRAALNRLKSSKALLDQPSEPHAPMDVEGCIQKAVQVARPCFSQSIAFRMEITKEKLTVSGSAAELQLLVALLLKNAARAPAGSPSSVTLSCRRSHDVALIDIKDDAPVTEDLAEDPAQGDAAPHLAGAGLRLAIVRRLAAHHQATVAITENPLSEGGITARVVLPLL